MSRTGEPTPYQRAVKFPGEKEAGVAYLRIQRLIDAPVAYLSAYRIQIHGVWHVVVVGDAPGEELAEGLERWLTKGKSVELPRGVLDVLQQRRAEQIQRGPWVEGHYRPGLRLRFRGE